MVIFFLPSTPVFEWAARNLVGLAGLMIIAGFVLAFWLKRKQKEGVPS
jgi:heme A synthase